jgi:hypothetical protein
MTYLPIIVMSSNFRPHLTYVRLAARETVQ